MNKLLQISFLPLGIRRLQLMSYHLKELTKISEENKKKIVVLFLCSGLSPQDMAPHRQLLADNGIINECKFMGHDYMTKIHAAINYCNTPYHCKVDNDIFINHHIWNFMIDNLHILDLSDTVFVAPLLNTGIPTTDMVVESIATEIEMKNIHQLCKNFIFGPLWGADYTPLNKTSIYSTEWVSKQFYKEVSLIPHHYKGIHPTRMSPMLHDLIFDLTKSHFELFIDKNKYQFIKTFDYPYYCNSIFFIKTSKWKTIIDDISLFHDGFDEVPLNLYCNRNNIPFWFIKNGYAIHPSYNTVSNMVEIETKYVALYEKYSI